MKRRSFWKWAAAFPLLAQVGLQEALGTGWAEVARNSTDNIYTRLGVKPLINGRGTWTYLSASLELPEVRAAQVEASQHFVNIFDLQVAAGKRLASLTGAESGMITSGAAGAMAVATAGCIAGTDPEKVWQLPNTDGLKNEVVMVGGRSVFDNAIRLAGGTLVLAQSAEQIPHAITSNTVMIYTTSSPEQLAKEIAIAKAHHVPIFMDAADGFPPVDKLQLFAKMGCDLYTFSGGKGLCGPQCSGLLLGRKDLIEAALANTSPWEGAVCRSMKVGKEEVMGCLAAVEAWTKIDLDALNREWNRRVQRVAKLVEVVPGVTTEIKIPEGGNRYPTLTVHWDEKAWNFSVADCDRELRAGDPRIEVLTASNPSLVPAVREHHDSKTPRENKIQIISMTMQQGEELIVGKRLRE